MTTTPLPPVAFILQVKVFFDPKDRETFLAALKPCYEAVLAEPECAYFLVGENAQEPGVFRWTEGWRKGVEWFWSEQLKKPYYEPYMKATEKLFIQPRIAEAYIPSEGFGHVKLDLDLDLEKGKNAS